MGTKGREVGAKGGSGDKGGGRLGSGTPLSTPSNIIEQNSLVDILTKYSSLERKKGTAKQRHFKSPYFT